MTQEHSLLLEAAALAKDLPDQLGEHSWAFEPYLVLSNPEAQNLVDLLIDEVCAQWVKTFDMRQPSTFTQQRFWDCGHAILANLMRAKCNKWPTTIGMYRSKGALDRERRYRPNYMTADRFRNVQDCLMRSGRVEMVRSGFNLPGYSQTSRFALTEVGTRELQADAWTYADFKVDRGREPIRLKDADDGLCGYDDTPETCAMRARLDEINTKLDATEIGTTRPLNLFDRKPEYSGRKVRCTGCSGAGASCAGGGSTAVRGSDPLFLRDHGMTQSLSQEFDALAKYGTLKVVLPDDISANLSSKIKLRPYQRTALQRWLFYIGNYEGRPKAPHLLFHMATGSGKTALMAALILDLYRRG